MKGAIMPKRLDPEIVQAIQREYGDVPAKEIAEKYKVSLATVFRLASQDRKTGSKNHRSRRTHTANGRNVAGGGDTLQERIDGWWNGLSLADKERICLSYLLALPPGAVHESRVTVNE
jgi:hypothetical protein